MWFSFKCPRLIRASNFPFKCLPNLPPSNIGLRTIIQILPSGNILFNRLWHAILRRDTSRQRVKELLNLYFCCHLEKSQRFSIQALGETSTWKRWILFWSLPTLYTRAPFSYQTGKHFQYEKHFMVNYIHFHFEKFIFVKVCGSLRSLLNIWIQTDQSLRTIKYNKDCPAVSV